MDRDYTDMVTAELAAVGLRPEFSTGGKHCQARWTGPHGAARVYIFPSSGSDRRGVLNGRSDLRRMLREDGLIGEDDRGLPVSAPVFVRDGSPFCSSIDVARLFGKAHKNVLAAIDGLAETAGKEFGQLNFKPTSYFDTWNREKRAVELSRDGFSMVVMGFTGSAAVQWKLRFLEAFNTMERELSAPNSALQARVAYLEGEVKAVSDLLLEVPAAKTEIIIIKKASWLGRRSVLRKHLARRA